MVSVARVLLFLTATALTSMTFFSCLVRHQTPALGEATLLTDAGLQPNYVAEQLNSEVGLRGGEGKRGGGEGEGRRKGGKSWDMRRGEPELF